VVVILALLRLPHAWRSSWDAARSGAAVSHQQRLLAPAQESGIQHPEVFTAAARLIPEHATYALVVQPDAKTSADAGVSWAYAFANSWLFPRRRAIYAKPGEWVLDWGVDAAGLPKGATAATEVAPRIYVYRDAAR